jgi:hypothetical protein
MQMLSRPHGCELLRGVFRRVHGEFVIMRLLACEITVLTENLIVLMIVEVVDHGLLAFLGRVRPYINDAEFRSCRASRPSCNASRDHRVTTSTDRAPTKSKVSATGAHSD